MSLPGKVVRSSVVIFYLLIGLEIIIMISPFAAFFYAAFNPILLWFAHWTTTRWLAATTGMDYRIAIK